MNLDIRAIRLRTRRQQGLNDDLSVDIVDAVVRLTRIHSDATPGLARGIAAHPSSARDEERHNDTERQRVPQLGASHSAD
jgi:hypothetical protein